MAEAGAERPDAAAPSYVLRARYHDGKSALLRLDRPRTRIGTRDAELVLTDGGVCPLHAELVFRDGLVGVRDLGSRRGTWVCGRRVDRAVLGPGRWFRVGHTTFELVEIHAGAPGRAADPLQTQLWSATGGLGARPESIAGAIGSSLDSVHSAPVAPSWKMHAARAQPTSCAMPASIAAAAVAASGRALAAAQISNTRRSAHARVDDDGSTRPGPRGRAALPTT